MRTLQKHCVEVKSAGFVKSLHGRILAMSQPNPTSRPRRSWADKLCDPRPHQVKTAPVDIAGMKAGQIMLVPTARQVDAFIRAIPAGRSVDVPTLRRKLARRHRAEVTCPITTGFHLRTVAEAALEAHAAGASLDSITPFWRMLDAAAPTTAKLSCGAAFLVRLRRREALPP